VVNKLHKLRTKITLSYIVISLVIVGLISVLANVLLENMFRKYIIDKQIQKIDEIIEQITNRYNDFNGGWKYDVLDSIGMSALQNSLLIEVKNTEGISLWDAWTHNNGLCTALIQNISKNMYSRYPNFDGEYVEENYNIIIVDKIVGSIIVGYYGPFYYSDNDLNFINGLNIMLMGVAIFSLIIAFVVGLFISDKLTKPILKVINAASQITRGDFSERVMIRSKTKEVRELIFSINNLAKTLDTVETLRKRMTSDIAHELRTPLAILQSHMEAMIDGIWELDKKRLKSCHDEILRLNRMVGDLKKLSDFESENLILNKTLFSLRELVDRTVLNFDSEFKKKQIHLIVQSDFDVTLCADRDKISQIIVNIISNALKYTQIYGTVRIIIEKFEENVVIIVRDSGIGISLEDLPFIFERFYRTDKSRTKSTGGSGIGLTITKSLVLAHGGDISVKSELDLGTDIIIKLPLGEC
jgi:two-component system, OmpR family, sensor histidine kinase BaeS